MDQRTPDDVPEDGAPRPGQSEAGPAVGRHATGAARRDPAEAEREAQERIAAFMAAADAPDDEYAADGAVAAPDTPTDGDEHEAGLRALLGSALFTGPDPDVAEDVLHEEEAEPSDAQKQAFAVAHAQAEEAVRGIYLDILARAPEHDVQPSLQRVADVLELLGDPHRAYPVIHLTGTNGKTSTARMIERLLREKGLRTGRFTSPHLHSVRERIALDGEPISPEAFVATWEDVKPYIEMVDARSQADGGPRLSFFEVFTVMAYAAFADAPVDVAVVEVGMGGRWDATNVADGTVEVLTRIDRDHERWLGHTLEEIAGEKVGIITDRSTVLSAAQQEEVESVIMSAAAQHGARLLRDGQDLAVVDRQLGVGGQLLTLSTPAGVYQDVFLPLHGEHQAHNALLALAAVETFFGGAALDGGVVEQGFAGVDSPGRLELVRRSPTVLVDAAHNPAGIDALRAAVEEAFPFSHLVGVVGVMADKDAEGILAGLEPLLAEVVVTRATTDRAMDVEELAEVAADVFGEERVHVAERLDDAIDKAATLAEADPEEVVTSTGILVAGSVILAAEARALMGRTTA
ncbi:bifunctional folylpolyglutamate synthase/dihydrofolate synthase [Georgenia yuyongxinii]|uniref:Dihydrofolate synthase/folylpolyglutamate synthase n=1 Tax=Georgenia yuyongxinii TaxID=2589797 RepID=A0A552WSB9_9MICO|nr:folylpolyglutamate synthase/dihydrofolate synthase family protein [Georgenia yuyongxinii]TRW45263.1 bifunctional folylpolyglutamate synthase/dihydrofolate synthase [Georgenia yuyongxinii]